MKVQSVSRLIRIARQKAAYFKKRAGISDLHSRPRYYSFAARELQAAFEGLPKDTYTDGDVLEFVIDVAAGRKTASECYKEIEKLRDAAYELRHGAHCLEIFAKQLVSQKVDKVGSSIVEEAAPLDLLKEAMDFRYSAIELFRLELSEQLQLAFELSYASKTLTFLRRRFHEFKGPEVRDKIVSFRMEAAPLFHENEEYLDANYEYHYLFYLFREMVKEDHSYYNQIAECALGSAETCRKGKLKWTWQAGSLWIAVRAYNELAERSEGAQKDCYREMAGKVSEKAKELEKEIKKWRK